jgi:threonine/homoserine/homoserine lactone efflux protein
VCIEAVRGRIGLRAASPRTVASGSPLSGGAADERRVLGDVAGRRGHAGHRGAVHDVGWPVARGARASLVAAAGCTLGIVPHLAAAVTGTAALLRASGVAFETVKLLGVAYLLYMAWATWRDRTPLLVDREQAPRSPLRVVGSAVLVNLLNPKLTLFFFAFLPQFVPARGGHQLLVMLGLSSIFMALTLVVFAGYGVFAAVVRRHLIDRPQVIRRVRQAFAASFIALGAKLATTSR